MREPSKANRRDLPSSSKRSGRFENTDMLLVAFSLLVLTVWCRQKISFEPNAINVENASVGPWIEILTLSDGDFKTSKQHHGLCEMLSKKSQETLRSVWLGTTTSSLQKARKNITPEALSCALIKKKNQNNYYAQFQRWYRIQWIRILSTFENLMA